MLGNSNSKGRFDAALKAAKSVSDWLAAADGEVKIGGPGDDLFAGTTMNDFYSGKAGNDRLNGNAGRDYLKGGKGDDILSGGRGSDLLRGGPGDDRMTGAGGVDVMRGGSGDDMLWGGQGVDHLRGGVGADTFRYDQWKQSTKDAPDVIGDFSQDQGDLIDIKDLYRPGLTFLGTDRFTGEKGEVRVDVRKNNTFVYGDIDGDGKADFAIKLKGSIHLGEDDFVL